MCNFGVFFKKLFAAAIMCFIICMNVSAVSVSASSAILINAESGECIFAKDADTRRGMASTTKIMTAIVAIENGVLDSCFDIPTAAIGIEGSSLYLKAGEKMTLRELLYGLMLRSANDAAEAIAIIVGGSVDSFVDMMNSKAQELGLRNTHFTNPHGLSNDEHYTTARELGIIAAYALKNETFSEICSTKKMSLPGNRLVVNHNKLLFSFEGTCGVKTGFTKATGRCLVSAAERDGVKLIAVTLNAPNDWNDHENMLETGFLEYESVSLVNKGDIIYSMPIIGGDATEVPLEAEKDVTVCLRKNRGSIVQSLKIMRPRFAPIYKGDVLGKIVFLLDSKEIASVPLVATEYVGQRQEKTIFDKIKGLFN